MKGYVPQGLGKPIGYLFALSPLHVPPGHVVLGRGTCEPKAALETASCSERPLPICLPNELSIWHPILRVTKGRASLHLGRCHEALRCARLPGHPSMHAGTSQCASDFMTRKPAQTWEEGVRGLSLRLGSQGMLLWEMRWSLLPVPTADSVTSFPASGRDFLDFKGCFLLFRRAFMPISGWAVRNSWG